MPHAKDVRPTTRVMFSSAFGAEGAGKPEGLCSRTSLACGDGISSTLAQHTARNIFPMKPLLLLLLLMTTTVAATAQESTAPRFGAAGLVALNDHDADFL